MTVLAQIEATLSKLTPGELAEVQTMLDRQQKSNELPKGQREGALHRPPYETVKPLLDKPAAELAEAEVDLIVRYNGFKTLRRRPGSPVTVEMVRQLMDVEEI